MTKLSLVAQQASFNSVKLVKAKDKAGWLALFADDAIVQDPVGVSPFDPTGQGFRGKAEIARFWEMVAGAGNLEVKIRESYPAGDACANVMTLSNTMPNGVVIQVDAVTVYQVNEAGKVVALRAYWDFESIADKLHAAIS